MRYLNEYPVVCLHPTFRTIALVILSLTAGACGIIVERDSAPAEPIDVSSIPDAVPHVEPHSPYGNPESYAVLGKQYYVMKSSTGFVESGIASWYGNKFHGKRTSSGETYDMYAMTAAHKTLPLPTYIEVTNLANRRKVIVRVNDRGPFHENRIIDLSYSAASKLGIIANGTGLVEIRSIDPANYPEKSAPIRTVSLEKGGVSSFYIQVGAFSQLVNAEELQKKLGSIGEHLVNISQAVIEGRTLYRVRIGPLVSVDNADKIVDQLAQLGISEHQVVTD